jgi:ADP-heptose:LPS heptosyltransferase
MSNILIIKHGSLGDIAQASGAIQDISEFYKDDDIYLLTLNHILSYLRAIHF